MAYLKGFYNVYSTILLTFCLIYDIVLAAVEPAS
jgi:hypothetical protein